MEEISGGTKRGAGVPGTRSRTHRVPNGEYHRVETTQVRFVLGGQVPERHVHGTGTVVVAVVRHGAHDTVTWAPRLERFETGAMFFSSSLFADCRTTSGR